MLMIVGNGGLLRRSGGSSLTALFIEPRSLVSSSHSAGGMFNGSSECTCLACNWKLTSLHAWRDVSSDSLRCKRHVFAAKIASGSGRKLKMRDHKSELSAMLPKVSSCIVLECVSWRLSHLNQP